MDLATLGICRRSAAAGPRVSDTITGARVAINTLRMMHTCPGNSQDTPSTFPDVLHQDFDRLGKKNHFLYYLTYLIPQLGESLVGRRGNDKSYTEGSQFFVPGLSVRVSVHHRYLDLATTRHSLTHSR